MSISSKAMISASLRLVSQCSPKSATTKRAKLARSLGEKQELN